MADIKKFLDKAGVSTLWTSIETEIANQVASEVIARDTAIATAVATEKSRAENAELALADKIGTLPDGTTNVISYVNKKTEGIATDAALSELQSNVNTVISDLDKVEADYLKSADKTELSDAISAEVTRATAAEKVNADAIDAIEADYLKTTDKTSLQGNIDAVNEKVNTLIGEDAGKSARTIANEELAKQLIADDAKESLDTLAEIATWIQAHPDDASAMNQAIETLENKVDTGDQTVSAYVTAAINALSIGDYAKAADLITLAARVKTIEDNYLKGSDKTALENSINAVKATADAAAVKTEVNAALTLKATQADLEAEVTARQNAVSAEETRAKGAEKVNADAITANANAIAAIKDHSTVDSFADVVSELAKKQNIISANTYDVYGAAATAESNANTYTDTAFNNIQALSNSEIAEAIANAKNVNA